MGGIDVLYLLDRLEEVLSAGQHVPLTSRTLIDEQECLELLDQIRVTLPEEIKQARRVAQERDRLLAEARAEAERIIQRAENEAGDLLTEHGLVRAAQARADAILAEAQKTAEETRRGADEYARQVLLQLEQQLELIEQQLDQFRLTVQRGIAALRPASDHQDEG